VVLFIPSLRETWYNQNKKINSVCLAGVFQFYIITTPYGRTKPGKEGRVNKEMPGLPLKTSVKGAK